MADNETLPCRVITSKFVTGNCFAVCVLSPNVERVINSFGHWAVLMFNLFEASSLTNVRWDPSSKRMFREALLVPCRIVVVAVFSNIGLGPGARLTCVSLMEFCTVSLITPGFAVLLLCSVVACPIMQIDV